MGEVSTAYCNLNYDSGMVEQCNGDSACVRKEFMKCLKASRYSCDKDFDKGRSVNDYLEELGISVQTIIATQHIDYASFETFTKADYIRAETDDGLPFIIYLDAKGHVDAEGCVMEMTMLQEGCFVEESLLNACYKICTPSVRGVALFTPDGITTCMYNRKMQPIRYHHAYTHNTFQDQLATKEDGKKDLLTVVVPYPIIPLSEIVQEPKYVSKRISFVLDPLRKLIMERSVKTSKEIMKDIHGLPTKFTYFVDTLFERMEELKCSIEQLREIHAENAKFKCSCENECQCEATKKERQEVIRSNIARRERYWNEMLSLLSALCVKMKKVHSLCEDIVFATEILEDRYSDFEHVLIDPSAKWAEGML